LPSISDFSLTKGDDYTILIIDKEVTLQEVIFKSQLLDDGHLYCPEEYAVSEAEFKVIVSLPNEKVIQTVRPFGLCKGEFRVPDDFDAPLPENIILYAAIIEIGLPLFDNI